MEGLDDSEVEAWKDFLVARSMQRADAEAMGTSYFAAHVRRIIPVPSELFTRMEAVFQLFAGLEFPSEIGQLVTAKTREVHA